MKKHYTIWSAIFIGAFLFLSCKKEDKRPFTLTITNPFDHDILIKGFIDGCNYDEYAQSAYCRIKPNGHQLYDSKKNSSNVQSVHIYVERATDGKQVGALLFEGKPGKIYDWVAGYYNDPVLFDSSKDNGASSLTGKWMNLKSCKNANGNSNYFQFSSNGTGKFFSSDCNSTCTGYGITFNFKYSVSGSTLSLNYTKTDNYCGQPVSTPSPEKLSFSKSGNVLSINGVAYTKVN